MSRVLHCAKVGPFAVCWRDAWTGAYGFSFEWTPGRGRTLIEFGFRRAA